MQPNVDPIDAASILIDSGLDGLVQAVIDQLEHGPWVNANADFNRSLMLRSPIATNQAYSNPFDISLPSSGHTIVIPNQTSPITNTFFLNQNSANLKQTGLTLPGTVTAVSDIDLTINNIRLLAQINWDQVTKIKNSGKSPATKALGFNKDVLVKILIDLGYKSAAGARAMKREAVVDKLLEYKRAYDQIIKTNPTIRQLLMEQAQTV